jgi:hypothetical protein
MATKAQKSMLISNPLKEWQESFPHFSVDNSIPKLNFEKNKFSYAHITTFC